MSARICTCDNCQAEGSEVEMEKHECLPKEAVTEFPSDKGDLLVEVHYAKGDPIFICGIHGAITEASISEIDRQLERNADDPYPDFTHGDGHYLFSVTWDSGQWDELGRCELAPYWGLTFKAFRTFKEASNDPDSN